MNRRELLKLALGLGAAAGAKGAEDDKQTRFREVHYPSAIYTLRKHESKTPGVYRMKLDTRTLEISLPEPEPDEFFMPEAVKTVGDGHVIEGLLRRRRLVDCFDVNWQYGFLRGLFTPFADDSRGVRMGGGVEVKPNTLIVVTDPSPGTASGAGGNSTASRRVVELNYFKLDDFIRAVHFEPDSDSYSVVTINGRQWIRGTRTLQAVIGYREVFYTPIDRQRILQVGISVTDNVRRYETLNDMPQWLREASHNITAVLRSIKLSRPDDGSPDPFLLDPEMKPEAEPVTFPGTWR